jgi:glucan biosynthesis protein C
MATQVSVQAPARVAVPAVAATAEVRERAGVRMAFFDNLRLFLTVTLVAFHLAITYGAEGGWAYRERPADMVSTVALTLFVALTQAYFMGLFFLIAGYFTPGALDRKGTWVFLKDRLIRLGIPLVVYELLFSPFMEGVKGMREGWLAGPLDRAIAARWQGLDFTPGPLWFVEALLAFSIAYALGRAVLSKLRPGKPEVSEGRVPLTQGIILAGVLVILIVTFATRIISPVGTEWRHLMLAAFPQYVILFAAGILAKRNGWLPDIAAPIRRTWSIVAILGLVAFPVMLIAAGALDDIAPFMGGLTWQSLLYSSWEAFYGVGMCIALLGLFRRRFDHQGKLAAAMAPDAYTVYIVHGPIIVGLALLLGGITLFPLLKWALVAPVAVALCFGISHLIRRIPYATRVL